MNRPTVSSANGSAPSLRSSSKTQTGTVGSCGGGTMTYQQDYAGVCLSMKKLAIGQLSTDVRSKAVPLPGGNNQGFSAIKINDATENETRDVFRPSWMEQPPKTLPLTITPSQEARPDPQKWAGWRRHQTPMMPPVTVSRSATPSPSRTVPVTGITNAGHRSFVTASVSEPLPSISSTGSTCLRVPSNDIAKSETKLEKPATILYVGGLTKDTSDSQLRKYFSGCGRVLQAVIKTDFHGVSTGNGFVSFENPDDVQRLNTLRNVVWKYDRINIALVPFTKPVSSGTSQPPTSGYNLGVLTVIPNRIFVGGLSSEMSDSELRACFSQYGKVLEGKVATDPKGVSKRYGFVTLESAKDAEYLLKQNRITWKSGRLYLTLGALKKPIWEIGCFPSPRDRIRSEEKQASQTSATRKPKNTSSTATGANAVVLGEAKSVNVDAPTTFKPQVLLPNSTFDNDRSRKENRLSVKESGQQVVNRTSLKKSQPLDETQKVNKENDTKKESCVNHQISLEENRTLDGTQTKKSHRFTGLLLDETQKTKKAECNQGITSNLTGAITNDCYQVIEELENDDQNSSGHRHRRKDTSEERNRERRLTSAPEDTKWGYSWLTDQMPPRAVTFADKLKELVDMVVNYEDPCRKNRVPSKSLLKLSSCQRCSKCLTIDEQPLTLQEILTKVSDCLYDRADDLAVDIRLMCESARAHAGLGSLVERDAVSVEIVFLTIRDRMEKSGELSAAPEENLTTDWVDYSFCSWDDGGLSPGTNGTSAAKRVTANRVAADRLSRKKMSQKFRSQTTCRR